MNVYCLRCGKITDIKEWLYIESKEYKLDEDGIINYDSGKQRAFYEHTKCSFKYAGIILDLEVDSLINIALEIIKDIKYVIEESLEREFNIDVELLAREASIELIEEYKCNPILDIEDANEATGKLKAIILRLLGKYIPELALLSV